MIGHNIFALEEIVSNIQTGSVCIDILADSLPTRKKDIGEISFLLRDEISEIEQYLGDIDTLISCEIKGVEIDA